MMNTLVNASDVHRFAGFAAILHEDARELELRGFSTAAACVASLREVFRHATEHGCEACLAQLEHWKELTSRELEKVGATLNF